MSRLCGYLAPNVCGVREQTLVAVIKVVFVDMAVVVSMTIVTDVMMVKGDWVWLSW